MNWSFFQIKPTIPYYWKDWTIIRQPSKEANSNESLNKEKTDQSQDEASSDAMQTSDESPLPEIESGNTAENLDMQNTKTETSQSDSIYIFNRWCALHLSVRSNGWLKYMMDRTVSTLYSSGKPVISDSESPATGVNEFSKKLLKCKGEIKQFWKPEGTSEDGKKRCDLSGPQGEPLFENDSQIAKFGSNWRMYLKPETNNAGIATGKVQLHVVNLEGNQVNFRGKNSLLFTLDNFFVWYALM